MTGDVLKHLQSGTHLPMQCSLAAIIEECADESRHDAAMDLKYLVARGGRRITIHWSRENSGQIRILRESDR